MAINNTFCIALEKKCLLYLEHSTPAQIQLINYTNWPAWHFYMLDSPGNV